MNTYETIVGMEVHAELKTVSKMFCGCKNDPFFASDPNIYTCPVCLGMPGALPVPNRKAVEWTVRLGLALGCEIPMLSKFDRKNYFYPDLPKGYQISQYDQPLAINGNVETEFGDVRIRRVHLEEDTGKLLHTTINAKRLTLIDFNRSGVPLVEIVTEPDIRSGDQAKAYLKKLQQIIRYLGISDADLEKGSMRLEPNISVAPVVISNPAKSGVRNPRMDTATSGDPSPAGKRVRDDSVSLPNYKVEVKNINSFNFVKKAIEYETNRQIKILEEGKVPEQETRGWKADQGITVLQRTKGDANDYRYFPEPDIPPMHWTPQFIDELRVSLPELPDTRRKRFEGQYVLNAYDSSILTDTPQLADYFEESVRAARTLKKDITPKTIANWIINRKIDTNSVLPAGLINRIDIASDSLNISVIEIQNIIEKVLMDNTKAVNDYKNGKEQAIMFIIGMVQRHLKGKGDTRMIKKIIEEKIKS